MGSAAESKLLKSVDSKERFSKQLSYLQECKLFSGLNDNELKAILELGKQVSINPNQELVKENDEGDRIYFILEGRVDVCVALPLKQTPEVIATLNQGDIVGELILIGKNRRTASVLGKDSCTLICWNRYVLLQYFEQFPRAGLVVYRNLASILSDRLVATNMFLRNSLHNLSSLI